jgi:hypothetical protein
LTHASGYRSTTGGGGGGEARVRASDAGFEKPRVRRKPRRVRRTGVPGVGHPRTPRRAPLKDHWDRRDVSISPRTGRPRDSREGSEPPVGVPGHRSEPTGRRNRPPDHRHEAGRRGPSDGGSRMPIDQRHKSG